MREYKFLDYYIPQRMMPFLERYLDAGIIPGDFLQAVICNNFAEAAGRADAENLRNLAAYAAFLYNEMPMPAWGSKEKMLAWSAQFQEAVDVNA